MSALPIAEPAAQRVAQRLILSGKVQGLGVRPAIARLAVARGLAGCVHNSRRGVEIEIEGPPESIAAFFAQSPQLIQSMQSK